MTGLTLSRRKYGDLEVFADEVKSKMSVRILNIIADAFSTYVQRSKLSGQVLQARSGRTRDSMGFYQLKRNKTPTYVVRPGRGITGRLNYLGGMSRGMLLVPKRGEFLYIKDEAGNITARVRSAIVRARPFMVPAWREWRGNAGKIMKSVYGAYVQKGFSKGVTEDESY